MNRRNFLAGLFVLPLIGKLIPASAEVTKRVPRKWVPKDIVPNLIVTRMDNFCTIIKFDSKEQGFYMTKVDGLSMDVMERNNWNKAKRLTREEVCEYLNCPSNAGGHYLTPNFNGR
jgi:hypothetical protein